MDGTRVGQRTQRLRLWPVLVLAAIAGLVFQIAYGFSHLGATSSDEAVIGLMARHIWHGQITTFVWGNRYGGPQEALLAAPLVGIFGDSVTALRVVPIVFQVAATVLVWRLGRRAIGDFPGLIAAAVFWVWPAPKIPTLLHAGYYGSGVFYCAAIALLALHLRERPTRAWAAAFGLVCGLAFWQTSQLIPIIGGTLLWLLWKAPGVFRQLWVALPAAALGAAPWLVWNVRHGWTSLDVGGQTPLLDRYRGFYDAVIPIVLGLRIPTSSAWLVPKPVAALIYVALVALFIWSGIRARRRDVSLLYVIAAVFALVTPLAPQAWLTNQLTYVIVLTPVLAVLIAQVATTPIRAAGLVVVLIALGSAVAVEQIRVPVDTSAASAVPRSFAPLIDRLDALHLNHLYADYWIAYRLDYATDERIIATEADFAELGVRGGRVLPPPLGPGDTRQPSYDAVVRPGRHGYVFLRRDAAVPKYGKLLTAHGYAVDDVGPFVIFVPRTPLA